MNAIYAFSHDHPHGSEDELTLQYLGIRLFNAAGVSVKLALSGYYQKAFDQVRDVIETYFLVDYLSTYPDEIDEWKRADRKKLTWYFSPARIRNELDKRDRYNRIKPLYERLPGSRKQLGSYPAYSILGEAVPTRMGDWHLYEIRYDRPRDHVEWWIDH